MSMYILRVLVRGLRDIRVNNTGACESGMGTSYTMDWRKPSSLILIVSCFRPMARAYPMNISYMQASKLN